MLIRHSCRRFAYLTISWFFLLIIIIRLFFTGSRHVGEGGALPGWPTSGTADDDDAFPKPIAPHARLTADGRRQACLHPQLVLWPPLLKNLFPAPAPLKCSSTEEDWIRVVNGTFRIDDGATMRHGGRITCSSVPIVRGRNDFEIRRADVVESMKDGDRVPTDVFEVNCTAADGSTYANIHSAVVVSSAVVKRSRRNLVELPARATRLNVLMFGFDSVSRMTWQRNLPKSHAFFVGELGATVLEGYNVVGDGTPQALLPILTGRTEPELPEARRGFAGAATVDNHPWIWKRMTAVGYVTQWGEQSPHMGTFTYRMLGFRDAPVDHYMRTYYMAAEPLYGNHRPYCVGSRPRHRVMLDAARDFMDAYVSLPKFSFVFHSEYTHSGYSQQRHADDDLRDFLRYLNASGHLDDTLLILMSDHGARFQKVRRTEQGKYEERMPYFGVRLPPAFSRRHPAVARNLATNARRLTTPFDVHATFEDVIHFDESELAAAAATTAEPSGDRKLPRGISLFREIPSWRTCADADVEPHWCACLAWRNAPTNDSQVSAASRKVVSAVNNITSGRRAACVELDLDVITSAVTYSAGANLLKFRRTVDGHGRVPDLSDTMNATEVLYQVTLTTRPGGGLYEATVKYLSNRNEWIVDDKEISRINKYGRQPHCVMDELPQLRPYCYCRVQLHASASNTELEQMTS